MFDNSKFTKVHYRLNLSYQLYNIYKLRSLSFTFYFFFRTLETEWNELLRILITKTGAKMNPDLACLT